MPNWVHNELSIPVGSESEAKIITDSFKSNGDEPSAMTFQRIIPRPETEEDWYHWQISNWGTKWDACDVEMFTDESVVRYNFNTAWSPPLPVIARISELHPRKSLKFVYEEEQGWGGLLVAENGKLTISKEWDIPESHADYLERGAECWCREEQVFLDCFYERAKASGIDDPKLLEAIKTLGADWSESFDRLIEVAKKL